MQTGYSLNLKDNDLCGHPLDVKIPLKTSFKQKNINSIAGNSEEKFTLVQIIVINLNLCYFIT